MDPATITTITQLVGSLGFPIIVAGYLLWERRTIMSELIQTLEALKEAIERSNRILP